MRIMRSVHSRLLGMSRVSPYAKTIEMTLNQENALSKNSAKALTQIDYCGSMQQHFPSNIHYRLQGHDHWSMVAKSARYPISV